jgi:NAD(P)-dependent dehydrogenase (short-subunit alcohol dehydrogenase family)
MVAATRKVWFITGAGRGMGADFARAVLAAGHALVATGRDTNRVSQVLGQSNDLLNVKLDVTRPKDAEAAVRAAVERFGRIDVLVNNAASFYAGFFEELTPEQIERQLATSLIGPMNVTRAVLPLMRKQRSGHVISISSSAGLTAGFEFVSAYAASKFGLEGWMESLHAEVAPFGITTTIVNPGFFRTELLTVESRQRIERPGIADPRQQLGDHVHEDLRCGQIDQAHPCKLLKGLAHHPPSRHALRRDFVASEAGERWLLR